MTHKKRSRKRIIYPPLVFLIGAVLVYSLYACTFGFDPNQSPPDGSTGNTGGTVPDGEMAQVLNVVDGDTIDVRMSSGRTEAVRYVGVNTPERDEVCYREAKEANRIFVEGKTVRLVKDVSDRDRYDRLLRYIYVDTLFVNRALVEQGYAEVVSYPPDNAQYDLFLRLEQEATSGRRGCHPTGIFNDGSFTR